MKALIFLCLLTFLPQQNATERSIPLIFRDRVEIVKLSEAQKEYDDLVKKYCRWEWDFNGVRRAVCGVPATESEQSRFVALTDALGTLPNKCTTEQAFAKLCLAGEPDYPKDLLH